MTVRAEYIPRAFSAPARSAIPTRTARAIAIPSMIFALIGSEIVAFGGKCKPGIHRGADSLSAQHADAQIGGDRGRIGQRSFEPRKDSRIDGLNDGADDERRLEIKIALRDFAAAHGLADHQAEN